MSAGLTLALAAVTCSAKDSRGSRTKVSGSRVLFADSIMAPLRPVQSVVVTVSAAATYNPGDGSWTYDYSVTNEPSSQNALETFALRPMWRPAQVLSPTHWMGSYGFEGDSMAVAWSVIDAGPDPPGWNGVQLYQGPYDPLPGQTVTGFRIVSRQSPTNLSFYAQGFDTLQTGGEEDVESAASIFVEGVTGTTIGPDVNIVVGTSGERGQSEPLVQFLAPSPNPASASVSFAYFLSRQAKVDLAIFDASGRQVRVLTRGMRPPGYHSTTWNGLSADGRRVAAGVYFYRLTVDGKRAGDRKLVIVR
jgi:hypothetical protein